MTDKPKKGELGYECEHGRLGRKCEICEAEETIARLTREIARQQARVKELEGLVRELADSLGAESHSWRCFKGPYKCVCGQDDLLDRARLALSPRTEAENG